MSSEETFKPEISVLQNQWAHSGPARALTAVAVTGPVGASYTVYSTNWVCKECQGENYPSRNRCQRCRAPKPEEAINASKIFNGRANVWREVFDRDSLQLYYYNTETQETRWDRPMEMGPAPHATGWFGRGAAGSKASTQYDEKNDEYLARPARKQADAFVGKNTVLEGAYEYNIWYNKYIGDHWDDRKGKDPADTRCVVARDSGFTKGDNEKSHSRYFCLFFARGGCTHGFGCQYAHRIPVRSDIKRLLNDELHDCFGRQRHKDHRDDMDGVGCLLKPCRTLYIGNLQKAKYKDPQALESALWKHFGEWGEVENVNVIARLSIGFVRYRNRASAEFAKEAMSNQELDQGEILNIRWAYDDPNPVAIEAAKRADADAVVNMMKAKGVALNPDNSNPDAPQCEEITTLRPDDYQMPAPKRIRLDGIPGEISKTEQEALDAQYKQAGIIYYPDTDKQYGGQGVNTAWRPLQDPNTSHTYYYNDKTGQSVWTLPEGASVGAAPTNAASSSSAP